MKEIQSKFHRYKLQLTNSKLGLSLHRDKLYIQPERIPGFVARRGWK